MASSSMVILVLSITICMMLRIYAQDTCGPIGSSSESMVNKNRDRMFYLNTADPAPCTGNVTSWRVCYYGPESLRTSLFRSRSYWATYAVYRRMGSGGNEHYIRVSEMFKAVRVSRSRFLGSRERDIMDGSIQQGGFRCYTDSLDAGASPLTVQIGDVLGACIFDPANGGLLVHRNQLDIVGEISGSSLLARTTDGCTMDVIPSDIQATQLSIVSSRRLHLHANVDDTIYMLHNTAPIMARDISKTTAIPMLTSTAGGSNSIKSINIKVPSPTKTKNLSPVASISTHSHATLLLTNKQSSVVHMSTSAPSPPLERFPQTPDQQAKVIGIAVGSTCGVLLFIAVLVTLIIITVCLLLKKCKKSSFDFSTNVAYYKRNVPKDIDYDSIIITKENSSYATSLTPSVTNKVDVEYESLHDSTSTEYYRDETKRSSRMDSLSLTAHKNVAYQSSMVSNVAYGSVRQILK